MRSVPQEIARVQEQAISCFIIMVYLKKKITLLFEMENILV